MSLDPLVEEDLLLAAAFEGLAIRQVVKHHHRVARAEAIGVAALELERDCLF
jgi:hypothetical protein